MHVLARDSRTHGHSWLQHAEFSVRAHSGRFPAGFMFVIDRSELIGWSMVALGDWVKGRASAYYPHRHALYGIVHRISLYRLI